MKISFCMHVIPFGQVDDAIPKLAAWGYEGLEFWEQYLQMADIAKLRKVLRDNSMKTAMLCPYFAFTSGREKWRWSIKKAEEYILLCRLLESSLIRTHTDSIFAPPFPRSYNATDAQRKAAARGLKKICGMGKKNDVSFALETTHGLLDSTESILGLIEEVGADNLGVNLQIPLRTDKEKGMTVMDTVENLGKNVIHVHANNWVNADQKQMTFLDQGFIDYGAVLKRLRDFGFQGYVGVEHAAHSGDPMKTAEREIAYLKGIRAQILQKK